VAHDSELLAFADAALGIGNLKSARDALLQRLGNDALTDAAAVVGGFDAITRVADGTGIPLEPPKAEATADWRARLGIDDYWRQKV
jgi:hypothetical protein